uniref:Uncharacterized protein n=1 Tax=Acrobeloides nanus TaxID=290746 RepID=A0A914D6V2_9BILA
MIFLFLTLQALTKLPPELKEREHKPEQKWAVVKMNSSSTQPSYKVVNAQKISGSVTVGSKLAADPRRQIFTAEVVEICSSEKKAFDCMKLLVYRLLGKRKRPFATREELKPKIWTPPQQPKKVVFMIEPEMPNEEEEVEKNHIVSDSEIEIQETFGTITRFFNKPEEDSLKQLNDRDMAKVHWLRQVIAREFHANHRLADEQLWMDCVKAINHTAYGSKAALKKKEQRKSLAADNSIDN